MVQKGGLTKGEYFRSKKKDGVDIRQYGWLIVSLCVACILFVVGIFKHISLRSESALHLKPTVVDDAVSDEVNPDDWYFETEISEFFPEMVPGEKVVGNASMSMTVRILTPKLPYELDELRDNPQAFNDKLAEMYGE